MRIPPEARERGRQTLIRMQKATRAALDEIVYGADPTWFIECNDERIMKCTVNRYLKAVPGIGPAKRERIFNELGIDKKTRVRQVKDKVRLMELVKKHWSPSRAKKNETS